MNLLVILLFIAFSFLVSRVWLWLVNAVFNPLIKRANKKENKPDVENPYIAEHLAMRYNDKSHEEYLEWLDRDGGGLPIKKILTQEEWGFEQQMKNQL